MAEATLTPAQQEKILTELRGRYDLAANAWQDIRDQGKEDMRYVAGDPWDPKDRAARIGAGRPCLSLDELGQYFNQVINDVRANPRAIKFDPTGSDASDTTATFYADKTREIEYRSHAQIAYTTAFENAVQRSYGWARVKTKYQPRSFNQDLWIEPIPNPDNVLPDPAATRPDSSDMKYLFYSEAWAVEEFQRAYPKAKVTSFGEYLGQPGYGAWVKDKSILLAEYWTIQQEDAELLQVRDPRSGQVVEVLSTELQRMPDRGVVLNRRQESIPTVLQYLTNGVELLGPPTRWAGKYIPFVSCFGKIIYVDEGAGAKRQLLSMTRLARDPYMLYCYYRTCEAELVGMTPKTPFIGYVGQFRTRQTNWQAANHEPQAYLEADPLTEATGQQILPLPQRQPYDPPIQALEIGAESARRAIQAAMGSSPLPTQAQRKNEKSGIALKQIEQTAQRGTYHFLDHYDDMIRQIGVVIEDLMDKIYDAPRDVGIRTEEDTAKIVRINDQQTADGQKAPISTKGDYLVTVSTGPAFESQRAQASDFSESIVSGPALGQIAQISGPQAAAKLLSQAIRLKQLGPIGDQMADTISPREEEGQANPAQMQQENAQLKQMLQQASQQMQELEQAVKGKQVEQQGKLQETAIQEQGENQRTAAKIQADERSHALDNLVKLAIAELNAQTQKADAEAEIARAQLGFAHQHAENSASRQHEASEAASARQHQSSEAASPASSISTQAPDGQP